MRAEQASQCPCVSGRRRAWDYSTRVVRRYDLGSLCSYTSVCLYKLDAAIEQHSIIIAATSKMGLCLVATCMVSNWVYRRTRGLPYGRRTTCRNRFFLEQNNGPGHLFKRFIPRVIFIVQPRTDTYSSTIVDRVHVRTRQLKSNNSRVRYRLQGA